MVLELTRKRERERAKSEEREREKDRLASSSGFARNLLAFCQELLTEEACGKQLLAFLICRIRLGRSIPKLWFRPHRWMSQIECLPQTWVIKPTLLVRCQGYLASAPYHTWGSGKRNPRGPQRACLCVCALCEVIVCECAVQVWCEKSAYIFTGTDPPGCPVACSGLWFAYSCPQ